MEWERLVPIGWWCNTGAFTPIGYACYGIALGGREALPPSGAWEGRFSSIRDFVRRV